MTNTSLNAPKARRGRRKVDRILAVEPLENRSPLTGKAFAIVDGVLPASASAASVTIQVSRNDFTFNKSGHVVLELAATGNSGAPVFIGAPVAITRGTVGRPSAAGIGWRIASLAQGQFTFSISGGAPGASYTVDFSLVGDVNGNGIVNRQDVRAIRSRLGVTAKSRRFLPGADPFSNDRIGVTDLRLAQSNLHAATSLEPLSISLSAVHSTGTNPLADVVVQSGPDTAISLMEVGSVQTGQTDSTGKATFAAGLLTGSNTFEAVATDSFGQRVDATASITRAALSNYLEAAFQPYVGQWTGTPPDASVPLFNSYGTGNDSVANQISLVATQFSSLATYSAGYAGYYPSSSQDNTVANEQAYFGAIQAWANQNQVETNWFEAIDEPWKANQNNSNTIDPQGIDGAEGHYGLWTYNSNGTDGQFTEKFTPGS